MSSYITVISLSIRCVCVYNKDGNYYLSKLLLGEDVVVSLPDSLNRCRGSKEAICNAKNGKDNDKNKNQCNTCLHGCRKTILDSPSITTVVAASHARVTAIKRRGMQYEPKKSK